MIELGIFDIDGTIKTKEGIPPAVLEGIAHLWSQDINTTVITARGYDRVINSLGVSADKFWSPSVPAGIEYGARLVMQDGKEVFYLPIGEDKITEAIFAVRSGNFDRVFYYPHDMRHKPVIWSPHRELRDTLRETETYAVVPTSSKHTDIVRMMIDHDPCMISVKAHANSNAGNRSRAMLNGTKNEGWINFLADGADKSAGVERIAEYTTIKPHHILFGGNDVNDIPVLERTDLGGRIIVGNRLKGIQTIPAGYVEVGTPEELGKYLKSMSY